MTTTASTIDGTLSASIAPAAAPAPARGAAPVPTSGIVLALLVAAALLVIVPPAGRLVLERKSTLLGASLQALCIRPGATPTDLDSALCAPLLRPRSAVRPRP